MSDPTEPSETEPTATTGTPDGEAPAEAPTLDERAAAAAEAERHLDGPGLRPPEERPDPEVLEQGWGSTARGRLDELLADLEGKRTGIAISGGGALGSFEAGALRFIYDHLRLSPRAVTGNSAGALNAAKLAHGDQAGRRAIDEVERLWRAMRTNSDMWEPEPWLEKIMASAQWAAALRAQPNAPGQSAGTMRMAARVINSLVRRPEATDGTIDAVRDALKAQSLLSLQPVAELIGRELSILQVERSGIELRVGSVALESGELRYVDQHGLMHDRHGALLPMPKVPLADGVLASASIPVAFPPVRLGDEHYVDGGAREILPLRVLVEDLGVERAFAISAGSTAMETIGSFAEKGLFDIMRRVTSEIAPNETLRKELAPPGGWNESITLVIPDIEVHDTMTIDPALIAISFDYGWMHTADTTLGADPRAAALTREITETRAALRRLSGPLPALPGRLPASDAPPTGITDAGWVDGAETLTSRLREQVRARIDVGAPMPASLLAWVES